MKFLRAINALMNRGSFFIASAQLQSRIINAIHNKKPAPMDCYDAAAWSAISALSEMSIARGGALVDFPDFTRGQWIHRQPAFALSE